MKRYYKLYTLKIIFLHSVLNINIFYKTLDIRTKVRHNIKKIYQECYFMKETYINCLKKLREFRKSLNSQNDIKRGKLYFTWLKDKTEKIINEKIGMEFFE